MIVKLSKRPVAAKHGAILNTALTLFLHWEFSDVSVKQIISAAGMSKGVFYRCYANKNELLLDLLMDEVFHMDQWVLNHQDFETSAKLVKMYFLEIGRHLGRYQLHQKIESYLEMSEPELFLVFKKWKKQHSLWVKHQLLNKDNKLDLLYAQLWAMLEGCARLQNHQHFQHLCSRKHPFEVFVRNMI
ncbi:MAG: TetR family transcriptional regulator [Saccharospirillaceae bacterium]|nr:TetR/AcrR family transcriptional regulator [Pseudomonadales bacterium]NRB78075.1 TetR family transcriptional regulator [Saccharospirillaceae bacterium]